MDVLQSLKFSFRHLAHRVVGRDSGRGCLPIRARRAVVRVEHLESRDLPAGTFFPAPTAFLPGAFEPHADRVPASSHDVGWQHNRFEPASEAAEYDNRFDS